MRLQREEQGGRRAWIVHIEDAEEKPGEPGSATPVMAAAAAATTIEALDGPANARALMAFSTLLLWRRRESGARL